MSHSCRSCLTRVALVLHSCRSCHTRVARVWYLCCTLDYFMLFYPLFYWRHQIESRKIFQRNSNKHGFQKQPFTFILQKRVRKKFAEFTWKNLRSGTPDSSAGCFPVNFAKFLRTRFSRTPPRTTVLDFFNSLNCFSILSELPYHGFWTSWWISWTLHSGKFTLRNRRGNTHFSETPAIKSSLKNHRSSCRCDSLIQSWFRGVL